MLNIDRNQALILIASYPMVTGALFLGDKAAET
jgi:hypothetical protein